MVRAAVPVLAHRAAELGHRDQRDVGHARAEVPREGGDRLTEVAKPVGELTAAAALGGVRVTPGELGSL